MRNTLGREKLALSALSLVAALGWAPAANAQSSFAKPGKFVVSAERLTGVYFNDLSTESSGNEDGDPVDEDLDRSSTTVSFLGSGFEAGTAGLPRVGFDYFLMQSFSLGVTLTYGSRSYTDEISRTEIGPMMIPFTTVDEVEVSESQFSIAPRAGYGMMFTNMFGLWARGGLLYTSINTESQSRDLQPDTDVNNDEEVSVSLFSLSLDAQFIISPIDHVAFGVGPLFDVALTGNYEFEETTDNESRDGDASLVSYGLGAGMLVWF